MCGRDGSAMSMSISTRAATIETKPCCWRRPLCGRHIDRITAGRYPRFLLKRNRHVQREGWRRRRGFP